MAVPPSCRALHRHIAYAIVAVCCLVGCHDADRDNALDPELTAAVEVHLVSIDSTQGTVALFWDAYQGQQPLRAYHVTRRETGQSVTDTLVTLHARGDTVFVDSSAQADHGYVYRVLVENRSGLEVASGPLEVLFHFEAPRFHSVELESRSATARLVWSRARQGFQQYEVLRQTELDAGPVLLAAITDIDDTTYADQGLLGNLEYRYWVVSRSSQGRELASEPRSGTIHRLIDHWEWPVSEPRSRITASATDPEGRIFVNISSGFSRGEADPKLDEPDRLYQFSASGELIRRITPEPEGGPPWMIADGLTADSDGLYVLMRKPESRFTSDSEVVGHIAALTREGDLRYRWPTNVEAVNLLAIAQSPTGDLWVAQGIVVGDGNDRLKLIQLDARSGMVLGDFELDSPDLAPLWPGILAVSGGQGGFHGFADTSVPILMFDPDAGKSLPFAPPVDMGIAEDFELSPDGRLFVLQPFPLSVGVFDGSRLLTRWAFEADEFLLPAKLLIDGGGRITVVEMGVRTWEFDSN